VEEEEEEIEPKHQSRTKINRGISTVSEAGNEHQIGVLDELHETALRSLKR